MFGDSDTLLTYKTVFTAEFQEMNLKSVVLAKSDLRKPWLGQKKRPEKEKKRMKERRLFRRKEGQREKA